jgi:predicted acetyltransferase
MENDTSVPGAVRNGRAIPDVSLAEATPAQRPLLERLLQLYLHDFSELLPPASPWGEVDEAGLFAYPPTLDPYCREPGRVPLLIRADGRVAGFALLNRWSALDRPIDHAMAEFFVLRKHRRAGVGTRAAHLTFQRYPGRWEAAVDRHNPDALPFWRSVVRTLLEQGTQRSLRRLSLEQRQCFSGPARQCAQGPQAWAHGRGRTLLGCGLRGSRRCLCGGGRGAGGERLHQREQGPCPRHGLRP